MTDFQVGDRVSVEGYVMETLEPGEVMLSLPQSGTTLQVWHEDLTLVERPRRKLRVGSVWQVREFRGLRYTYLGEGLFGATSRQKIHERDSLTIDTEPDIWREVPVEELEREAGS